MWNFRLLAFYCGLFFINYTFSQDFKEIPDSLKKYSYEDLDKIMTKKKNKYKNTYVYAKTYLLKAKKESNVREVIYGYVSIGSETNNLEFNLKYSDSAISLAQKKKPDDLSYLYYLRGSRYYSEKKLKEALNCFLMASKYPNTSIDLADRINYSIGLIKNTQGNYEEAISIYKKCEENGRIPKFQNYLLYVLGLSELYNRVDKIALSEKYINIGISSCKDYDTGDYYLSYFISNRGKNYFKTKKYQKAVQDLTSQLKNIQHNNDFSNYAENSFYIGECYRELHQDQKAMVFYKKVDSIFVAKKDIYLTTITAYQHLIDYYKKQQDYKNELFYSDQFIKADKVLDDNYKYLTTKIIKTYDIQKVVSSKQAVITSLKKDKKNSTTTIIFLLLGIVLLLCILHINNKNNKKELQKQKELFEAYRLEREQQSIKQSFATQELNIVIAKKTTLANIDESVIAQILSCLAQFEKERWYLNKE